MSDEMEKIQPTPTPDQLRVLVAALLAGLVAISIVFYLISPLEPQITYLIIAGLWAADLLAIRLLYSQLKKKSGPSSSGLVWSGFGEQRPDIGSRSPSQRR